jgi:lysophospholipase L1-like esterase
MRALLLALTALAALNGCRSGEARATSESKTGSPQAEGDEAVRWLALGDSFTAGTGASPAAAYPIKLASYAHAREPTCTLDVKNVAVNGYTTDDVIELELPALASFEPRWVSLAIGANDLVRGRATESYRAQVRKILAAVLEAGVAADHVVVLPQPDWSKGSAAKSFGSPDDIAARIADFDRVLAEETKAIGARFLDLKPLMRMQAAAGQFAPDGLHPNAVAYDAWASAMANGLPSPCR